MPAATVLHCIVPADNSGLNRPAFLEVEKGSFGTSPEG
jgi:hypothetical protein